MTAIEEAVLPGTPERVVRAYEKLAETAKTRSFGLIEDDVVVLDTETTGLRLKECELTEIAAARLSGREVTARFRTFVHPERGPIPPEIVRLTGITDEDVADAPSAREAVAALADFVGGQPVIAHNAAFDRSFIEAVPGGTDVSGIWVDSLALSRIALSRLRSHKLADLAQLFGCDSVSHRASDDVDALCGVWRIILCGLADLPGGLMRHLADMRPDVPWAYRPIFSFLAGEDPDAEPFSLAHARDDVLRSEPAPSRKDVLDLPTLDLPSAREVEEAFAPGGAVSGMYGSYEPRPEQVEMAEEVRDALETGTHRAIEAGTGVGKSVAYLYPLAEAAKRNRITVGVATKTNNLTDQLIYHELPALSQQMGGLDFFALKGYEHYPCLRKLEHLARGTDPIQTDRDPADTLTAIAVIEAFSCQSSLGDLDALGIRWKSVDRASLTTSSKECARRLCPFFPDRCFVHGARRRAAAADIVVTNHSLLCRNIAAEGKILPPIRCWVVDEAHSFEGEARRQWAETVSSDEVRGLFERLGGRKTGEVGRLIRDVAASEESTLFMGLLAKSAASCERAQVATANLFDAVRACSDLAEGGRRYDVATLWIGPEVRGTDQWAAVDEAARTAADALDEAHKNLAAAVSSVGAALPEAVSGLSESCARMQSVLDALRLIAAGEDDRYVYSLQVARRLRAGGESLRAERLDIGAALAQDWLPEMRSVVFTSATLSVSKSFSHFMASVGLNRLGEDRSKTLHLESGYDYDHNMSVLVAADMPDPRTRGTYMDALCDLLRDVHLALGGSVLTLFTNRREMEEAYRRVEPDLAKAGLRLAYQYRGAPTRRLRDEFKRDERSSLFALKAFWEGFDASGDTLRCVVIPKLPFSSPNDPLSKERGLRDPHAWSRYALPEAVLEVKQAAGRLIRSSSDSGVLVLADSRLVSKGYGRQFLKSLPTSCEKVGRAEVGRYLEEWSSARSREA